MSGRLDGIQILRFFAAALVLIQHAAFLPSLHYSIDTLAFRRLGLGTAGVFVFFAISGYVIAGLVDQRPLKFALHRCARIYPPYIAAMAIAAAIAIAFGTIHSDKIRWLWSFTLLPLGGAIDSWSQVPFWTLIYEMTFYLVALVLMLGGKRAFDVGLVLWASLIVLTAYFLPPPPVVTANFLAILTSPLSILFVAGAALGRLHAGSSWPLACIALVMWTSFWRSGTLYQSIPMFAVGSLAAIHLSAIGSKLVSDRKWLKPLVRGGDYSYGLYLIHAPIISGMLLLGLASVVNYWTAIAVCIIFGGGIGLVFGFADFKFYRTISRTLVDQFLSSREQTSNGSDILAASSGRSRSPAGQV